MLIFQVSRSWACKETTAVSPTPSSNSWEWAQVNLSSSSFVLPSQKKITKTFFWATTRNLLQVQGGKTELLQQRNWLCSDSTKTVNYNQTIIQIHWQYVSFKECDNLHCATVRNQNIWTCSGNVLACKCQTTPVWWEPELCEWAAVSEWNTIPGEAAVLQGIHSVIGMSLLQHSASFLKQISNYQHFFLQILKKGSLNKYGSLKKDGLLAQYTSSKLKKLCLTLV